ncbi:MAG TPA: YajG family lipoprotein [Smithellaceae bacterium]|nr:YajG family lipoprotein [Smithellaceae bacterium]
MKITAMSERKNILIGAVALFLLLLGSGCANVKLYSVDMRYGAEKVTVPDYLRIADKVLGEQIVIAEFLDSRKVDDTKVIGRVIEKDGSNVLILPKFTMPAKAVAQGIRNYLSKAGYKIPNRLSVWDLKEETMPQETAKLLIGGSIEEMELTCRKGFPSDTYKARVKLSVIFADLASRKILYKSTVESSAALEHVSFSEKRMEEQINNVLAEAVEKLFEDKEVAQNIKDVTAK